MNYAMNFAERIEHREARMNTALLDTNEKLINKAIRTNKTVILQNNKWTYLVTQQCLQLHNVKKVITSNFSITSEKCSVLQVVKTAFSTSYS